MLKKDEIVEGLLQNEKLGYETKKEVREALEEAERLVNAIVDLIPEVEGDKGEKAKGMGLTFTKKVVPAHEARNPRTKETVIVERKTKTTVKLV